MLRKSRLYVSAMIAAVVLVSLLITPNVKACEEEPLTLLSLYMNSDLVVIAKYDSESEAKKTNEDEYGYSLESERNLVFSKIFKGQTDLKSASFAFSEYVSKQNSSESGETEGEVEHYFDISKIKTGEEYLFFLSKNEETGQYTVTDYSSGVRELGKHSAFYEKSLEELSRIITAKENQHELLTEWIVKNLENPATREDGIGDLAESFNGLQYQQEDPKFKDKGPFVELEEGYKIYTVGVAKHLTQSQKERISSVLYAMLQEAWFSEKPKYVNYGISSILGRIDKPRLAIYTHNALQNVGKTDAERKRMISEFLIDTLGDEEFSNIYYALQEIEGKIDEMKTAATPQAKKELKALKLEKIAKSKELEKRFRFLQSRNFVTVEAEQS